MKSLSINAVYLCNVDIIWTVGRAKGRSFRHSISSSESEMSSLLLLLARVSSVKRRRAMKETDALLLLSGGSRDLLSVIVVTYHPFLRRPLEKQTFSTARPSLRQ